MLRSTVRRVVHQLQTCVLGNSTFESSERRCENDSHDQCVQGSRKIVCMFSGSLWHMTSDGQASMDQGIIVTQMLPGWVSSSAAHFILTWQGSVLQQCLSNTPITGRSVKSSSVVSCHFQWSLDAGRSTCLMSVSHVLSLTDSRSCQAENCCHTELSEALERLPSVQWWKNILITLKYLGHNASSVQPTTAF